MLPAGQLEALVLTLHDIGAIRFGQFTLHSGRNRPSTSICACWPPSRLLCARLRPPIAPYLRDYPLTS